MASLFNSATPETPAQPWHAAYPAPKCTAPVMSRREVLKKLKEGSKDFVLVDLRRADFEVSKINIHAQPNLIQTQSPDCTGLAS